MMITKLRAPSPRATPRLLRPFDFGITGVLPANKVTRKVLPRFDRILTARHSNRDFSRPLKAQGLTDLCWHAMRTQTVTRQGKTLVWESRPSPSGGGCHPISVV